MIKSLLVENFRSINEPVLLNLTKSNRKKSELNTYISLGNWILASSAVIYGANASGKSNLLKAFKAIEFLVLNSARFEPNEAIAPYEPFKLIHNQNNRPVCFELDFFVGGTRFIYTLHFSENRIEYEKLIHFPSGREALLFERKALKEISFGDFFKGEKRVIERLTLPNQLFLSKAAENNSESCMAVYQYFKSSLRVYPFLNQYNESGLERFYASRLAAEPESAFSRKLNALVCALDTGICSVKATEADWASLKFPNDIPEPLRNKIQEDNKYEIKTTHDIFNNKGEKTGTVEFDISEESNGTRNLLSLGGIIIDALEKGSILIIDEFENSLHPLITSYIIQLFSNQLTNPKKSQIIFATHDSTLLNEEIFNRDQIWFTQKNEKGETELYRCSDINGLRLHTPLDKWYLSGRLGGVAVINDTDFILAIQEDD